MGELGGGSLILVGGAWLIILGGGFNPFFLSPQPPGCRCPPPRDTDTNLFHLPRKKIIIIFFGVPPPFRNCEILGGGGGNIFWGGGALNFILFYFIWGGGVEFYFCTNGETDGGGLINWINWGGGINTS